MFDEKDVQQVQIASAFFQEYIRVSEGLRNILEITDEVERSRTAAIEFPTAAKYLERHTPKELEAKLMISN